ncbi:MAG: multicopper oxidase family protein [Myxococcales bacterium]|nr:multicopper oxidase family protein [Myxococcales bacterium]
MQSRLLFGLLTTAALLASSCSEPSDGTMKHDPGGMSGDTTTNMADTPSSSDTNAFADDDVKSEADVDVAAAADPCGVPTAVDRNDEAQIVEVDLRAAPIQWDPGTGVPIDAYAYNGTIPGPLIKARVGDTVRVHFTNDLPEETTIHWHGLRVPAAMDGVVHEGTKAIPAGGTFEYEFVVNDPGFFWYHPHLNTASQVERGLYAPFLVEPAVAPGASCTLPLVLDDILLRNSGSLVPGIETKGDGRLGNRLLSNGVTSPLVKLPPGTQVVLHLVNAANARYFDLALREGLSATSMTVVATDGGPVSPQVVDHLVIAPGDRYSVYINTSQTTGNSLFLETRPFELHEPGGMMDGPADPFEGQTVPILTLGLVGDPVDEPVPEFMATPLETISAPQSVAHGWVIDDVMDHSGGGMTMTGSIDGETWPNVPVLSFQLDTPVRLTLRNDGYMHHPFHIHGQRFLVVDVNGAQPAVVGWEDTVDLPPRGSLTLLSRMDNPGMWMYHCHILEHAESGMMAELHVVDK